MLKDEYIEKFLDILFIISVPFLTLLLCGNYNLIYFKILFLFSFISGIFIKIKVFKRDIYKDINIKYLIFSIIFSLYANSLFIQYSSSGVQWVSDNLVRFFHLYFSLKNITSLIGFLSIPSTVMIVYYLSKRIFPVIKSELLKLTKMEKRFFLLFVLVGFFITIILYEVSTAFYYPHYNDAVVYYDVIYTSDSGGLANENAFLNIGMSENDLRQPLFGLFAAPFSIVAKGISELLFFIPNSYFVIFNVIQIILLALSLIMIKRMLNSNAKDNFLFFLFCLCSYTILLFSFLLEQYVIAFFYLILAIYFGMKKKTEINYLYIGAVGTLLTSGIIFPLISKFKNLKYWVKNVWKCFVAFIITMVLSGQILQVFTLSQKVKQLMIFTGKDLAFGNRVIQFLSFVQSIFIAPKGKIVFDEFPSYQLQSVSTISFIGILILIICVISFIMNRKDKFTLISFLWVLFSFVILAVFGWGTQENGLILYALYFYWAYAVLIYKFLDKIISKVKLKYLVIACLCLAMFLLNVEELYKIVMFSIRYYPN